jgi:ankyrin repeat protein
MSFHNKSSSSAPAEWDILLSSAQKNNAETILTLITQQGVDPNHANRISQSALHIASLWGHIESVEILLQCGANPNVANTMTGATPLHCAVQSTKASSFQRQVATIQALLEAGADASRGDFFGSTPLDYCQENDALVELLRVQVPPVFRAVDDKNVPQLESMLQADSSVVQSRHESRTPLLHVVHKLVDEPRDCYLEMMRILLQHGANPNEQPTAHRDGHFAVQQNPGDAALHQVCTALKDDSTNDIFQNAALLLKEEYDATVTPETQQLLHDAARRNQVDLVKFLIEKMGMNVNTRGRQGMTPLCFAARSGKTEMVEYLLQVEGIDVSIANDLGQTALVAARVNGEDDVVALLEQVSNK